MDEKHPLFFPPETEILSGLEREEGLILFQFAASLAGGRKKKSGAATEAETDFTIG